MKKTLKYEIIKINIIATTTVSFVISVIFLLVLFKNINDSRINQMTNRSYEDQITIMRNLISSSEVNKRKHLNKMIPYYKMEIEKDDTTIEIITLEDSYMYESERSGDFENAFKGIKSYSYLFEDYKLILSYSSPIYTENGYTIGIIRYKYNMYNDYKILIVAMVGVFFVSIINIILVYSMSLILSNKIINPMKRLQKEIDNVEDNNFNSHVEVNEIVELNELGNSYNKMINNINSYIKQLEIEKQKQMEFFNQVTHNLKTPLTSIIGYAELIEKSIDPQDILEYSFIIEEEGLKQLSYIQRLLSVNKSNHQLETPIIKTFNLKELLDKGVRTLKPRLEKQSIKVIKNYTELRINSDYEMLEELILILLDNAILHSNCNTINVSAYKSESKIIISVTDDGIGVKDEEIDILTNIYYRGYSKQSIGSGVGLFAAKNIIKALEGDLIIENNLKGLKITIKIPNVTDF